MGVPKRRVSHAAQGDRRAHHALTVPELEACPHCHQPKLGAPRLPQLRLVRRSRGRAHPREDADRASGARGLGRAVASSETGSDDGRRRPSPAHGAPRPSRRVRGSPSTPWAATTRPRRSCAAPSTGPASTPTWTSSSSVTRRASAPFIEAPLPSHVTHRARPPRSWAWTSTPRPPCAASGTPASTCACASSARARRTRSSRPATPAPAWPSAILHLGRLPGVDRPALAVQMVTDSGPFVLLDIGATTDSTGLNLAQYAHMGALYAERVLGVDRAHGGAAVHRRGGRQGRAARPGRHDAAQGQRPALRRQRRGHGPRRTTSPTWSSATRRSATWS